MADITHLDSRRQTSILTDVRTDGDRVVMVFRDAHGVEQPVRYPPLEALKVAGQLVEAAWRVLGGKRG